MEGVAVCKKVIQKNPNFIYAPMLHAAGLRQLGQMEKAALAVDEWRRLNAEFSLNWAKNLFPYKKQSITD